MMIVHLCGHEVSSHAVVIACVLLGIAGCVAWGLYGWWADRRWREHKAAVPPDREADDE